MPATTAPGFSVQRQRALLLCLLLLSSTTTPAFCARTYTITDLGDLPGGADSSEAYGINASGQVVGTSIITGGASHAFVWTSAAGMTDLGDLPGGLDFSEGRAINDSGQIVGYSGATTGMRAFLWTSAGGMKDLGDLPGGADLSKAHGISASGQVVGVSDADTGNSAFVWTVSEGMKDIGDLPGGPHNSCAYAINVSGEVVGYGHIGSTAYPGARPFLWTPATGMKDLGDLHPDKDSCVAHGISAAGHVVGASTVPGTHSNMDRLQAFLWTSAAGMTSLGSLPGVENASYAYGVNAAGDAVGWISTSGPNHAFLWTSNEGMQDLNACLPAGSGWTLLSAYAINDAGQIVGVGLNPSGKRHAFLLTPSGDEPSSPRPIVSSLTPSSASKGGPSFTLTVDGTGFVSTSKVRWNASDRPTTYVSATRLTATIGAADIANVGAASVTVYTPAPGGGTSAGTTFTITDPAVDAVSITSGPSASPNPVGFGGIVSCTVTAVDSQEHNLSYSWSATAGSFDDATSAAPKWTAPGKGSGDEVTCTLSVTVTCSAGKSATGACEVDVTTVSHAIGITRDPLGRPNPVASGGTVQLLVTAEDTQGHALAYAWSATNSSGEAVGSFSDASSNRPTWKAPANTTGANVVCTITVTVSCTGGQSVSRSFSQEVTPPEIIEVTAGPSGTPDPVASGGSVQCSVSAADPLGHALSYRWSASAGRLSRADSPTPVWTAPENPTDANLSVVLSVEVTCSRGASVTASYMHDVEPAPDEVRVTAGPLSTPDPVASGGSVQCSVSAQDSRNHALSYAWTACDVEGKAVGSFDDAGIATPRWTAPENPTGSELQCTLTVTVTCTSGETVSPSLVTRVAAQGDIDINGTIDSDDLRRFILGWTSYRSTAAPLDAACDLDHDGDVDVADARLVLDALCRKTAP